jgi:ABC-type oligopeptide transport system substrate-binding subunit
MMGSGPYKLVQFNPDPNDGFQVYQSWSGYWQGQAPTPTCIIKAVPEWSNRKAEFLSTNPALQCDLTDVPEIDAPELTTNGSINGPLLPGLSLTEYNEMEADYMFFTYNMSWQSDYVPLLGTTPCPTLFSDRDLRLAFMYAFNSTQYLQQCWLGEATQPTTFMCNGTDYYNGSSAFLRNIDLAKAQYYLDLAWGGAVEKEGITVDLVYDNGTFRQTIATMLADTLMNRLNWTSGAIVNITTSSVSWPTYVGLFASSSLPVFCAGWSADYPDASDWAGPFMSPEGPWGTFQAITYGLNTTSLNADWPSPADYGPIPYLGSLGRWVTGLNGTYVDQLIDAATHAPTAAAANASYQELQDIFYAEAATLPTDQAIGRHYERDWIHGWVGGYSNNPIAVGPYFYQLWKALPTPETQVYGVDLNALDSITNTSEVYPLMQVVNVSMAAQREMVWHGSEAYINYTVHVRYENITGPVIYANIELKRTNVWTGEYYYVYIATERLENNTDYTFHVTWNETNSTQDGTWAISFCADPIGTTGGEVYPTNTSELEVNSTYEVMIGPPILGNLGSRVYNATSGVSQNEFGVFSGTIGPTDLSLFLQCYHGTAPAQWMYLADLGSRVNGVNTFFAYSAVIGPTDLSLFLQCYHGLGPS